MSERYRIYRRVVGDPFGSPRGWLAHVGQMPMWVPADSLANQDTYSLEEANTLVSDWQDYWNSKGMHFRAEMELVE